jgi:hypothetical protein
MVRTESLVFTEKVFAVTPGKPRGREPALVLLTIALSGSGMREQVRPSLTSTPGNVALRSVTTADEGFELARRGWWHQLVIIRSFFSYDTAGSGRDLSRSRDSGEWEGGPNLKRLLPLDRPLRVPSTSPGGADGAKCDFHE